jgi:transposase-like protein
MKRKYSLDFKQKVIKQALEMDSIGKVARQNRLNSQIIYRWVKEYKQGKFNTLFMDTIHLY